MEKNFKLDDPDYYSMRFGLIVLQSDETIEQEIRSTLDESVAIYHSRIPCDQSVNNENLAKMENDLPIAVDLLPKIDFNSIGYACTSGATVIGSDKINKLIKGQHKNAFITDPIRAVKEALNSFGCKNIAFVSPYEQSVTQKLKQNLQSDNFNISKEKSFDESDDTVVARISERESLKAVLEIGKNDCDAVFISCTNLKTFKIIDEAERLLNKPVVSSNQAMIWHMFRGSGNESTKGPGMLFKQSLTKS